MIELLVMRHAKSDWTFGVSDFDRPLNDRGERAADRMAEWLVAEQLCPDRVVSSAAQRTRSTATAVAARCAVEANLVVFDNNLYLADAFTWLQEITKQEHERVLICGHNPGLDDLVDYLSPMPTPLTDTGKLMTTAAIAHFRFPGPWSDVSTNSGELVQLIRPRELPGI